MQTHMHTQAHAHASQMHAQAHARSHTQAVSLLTPFTNQAKITHKVGQQYDHTYCVFVPIWLVLMKYVIYPALVAGTYTNLQEHPDWKLNVITSFLLDDHHL